MANIDNKNLVRAIFTDDDTVLSAVRILREKGMKIKEVYSPFPIHGLDKAMGLKETRIAMASFMYGLFGLAIAITLTAYTMNFDWPQISVESPV